MKGSLNTMTYLKPYGFFSKIKLFFKNHHTADIQVQYEIYNVRTFDFHIDFTKSGRAFFRYDGIPYETFSVYNQLNYLNKKGDTQVRIVLEGEGEWKERKFCEYCTILEKIYKDIRFFGGYREHDKRQLFAFKNHFILSKIDWCNNLK